MSLMARNLGRNEVKVEIKISHREWKNRKRKENGKQMWRESYLQEATAESLALVRNWYVDGEGHAWWMENSYCSAQFEKAESWCISPSVVALKQD